jgi:hypothetical protein
MRLAHISHELCFDGKNGGNFRRLVNNASLDRNSARQIIS